MPPFELQGHRGARGLRPENTLPSFEAALDAGVTSVETDLHLTRDGAVVLCHDPYISTRLFAAVQSEQPIAQLTLAELRRFCADRNPDPSRFPRHDSGATPVAALFAAARGFPLYTVPTLSELFDFASAYAGDFGAQAGKTPVQRARAGQLLFDLELKRVPFFPEAIGDGFDGSHPGRLEQCVAAIIEAAGQEERTRVRSFDHRSVACMLELLPRLAGAVLVADTAPVDPASLARAVGAGTYCPAYAFVDFDLVKRVHAGGVRIVPWTVNAPDESLRLIDWGVDGITTDYPDMLASMLNQRGLTY